MSPSVANDRKISYLTQLLLSDGVSDVAESRGLSAR
ncbi:MAG: hypothetical protein AVDCRST_MAG93-6955, partial [uncultured Chloroflexia bacterium]